MLSMIRGKANLMEQRNVMRETLLFGSCFGVNASVYGSAKYMKLKRFKLFPFELNEKKLKKSEERALDLRTSKKITEIFMRSLTRTFRGKEKLCGDSDYDVCLYSARHYCRI